MYIDRIAIKRYRSIVCSVSLGDASFNESFRYEDLLPNETV